MTVVQKRVLIGVGALVALLLIGYLLLAMSSGSTARPGTTVQGIDISGMSQSEAAAAVEAGLGPIAEKRLRVRALDETVGLRPEEAGLALDAEASVAPAFGHTWNPVALIAGMFGSTTLPAVAAVDEPLLSAQIDLIAQGIDLPAVEPSVDVEKGEGVITPGTDGRELDREATAAAMTEAFLLPRAPVEAVVVTVEPTISDEATAEALALVSDAQSAPVTVKAGTVTAEIPAKAVARALGFAVESGRLVPTMDGEILHEAIAEELSPIEVEGRDATFRIKNGKPKVVKSKVGTGVSDEELAAAVAGVLALPAAERVVTVPVGTREPSLTTEQAKALGVNERLSTFTQNFPYAAYRSQNIGRGRQAHERHAPHAGGDVLAQRHDQGAHRGERLHGGVRRRRGWSVRRGTGRRRLDGCDHRLDRRLLRGYGARPDHRPLHLHLALQPGSRGHGGLGHLRHEVPQRHPERGLHHVRARRPTSITVSMWGTKQYDDMKAEFGERKSIVPFEKIYDESEECLGQNGVDGFTITVDRVFYKDGEEVKREPITTRYKPAPDVTCGPKPDKKPGKNPDKGDQPAGAEGDAANGGVDPAPPPSDAPPGDDVFSNE